MIEALNFTACLMHAADEGINCKAHGTQGRAVSFFAAVLGN